MSYRTGGFTVLATKATSTLLTKEWGNMLTEWITYPVLAVCSITFSCHLGRLISERLLAGATPDGGAPDSISESCAEALSLQDRDTHTVCVVHAVSCCWVCRIVWRLSTRNIPSDGDVLVWLCCYVRGRVCDCMGLKWLRGGDRWVGYRAGLGRG